MSEKPKLIEAGFNLTNYEAFVKQALELKEQLRGEGIIPLSEEWSAIIKQEIVVPKKLKGQGSCTFPCIVRSMHFDKAMCYLRSKISLMPMSLAVGLGIHEKSKNTRISIQLVNKSAVKSKGVIEDVLVRVDKFTTPIDFMVLNIEVDKNIYLIFGRPFLTMGKVLIGVRERTMTFHVNREEVMCEANSTPHYPKDMVGWFIVQVLDKGEEEGMKMEFLNESTFDTCDACDVEYKYYSHCILDDERERYDNKEGLIEELCAFAAVKVKNVSEKT